MSQNVELSKAWANKIEAWPKQCWSNCVKVMRRMKDPASYVEGWARMIDLGGIVIEHGWIELPDGTIIDPTLPDKHIEYHPGVRYSRDEVTSHGKRKPPFVWGGKHGFGGFGHPEYKKAHDTAWLTMKKQNQSESRKLIDRLTESPYYRCYPSTASQEWAERNKVGIVKMSTIPTMEINSPSLPELLGDLKFTSLDDRDDVAAFLAQRQPDEKAIYIKHKNGDFHNGVWLVLATPDDIKKLERRRIEGNRTLMRKVLD